MASTEARPPVWAASEAGRLKYTAMASAGTHDSIRAGSPPSAAIASTQLAPAVHHRTVMSLLPAAGTGRPTLPV
ncbi:MAG: hypothetical protein AMXMBFR83_08050 [Phycisphaerae bacterium]